MIDTASIVIAYCRTADLESWAQGTLSCILRAAGHSRRQPSRRLRSGAQLSLRRRGSKEKMLNTLRRRADYATLSRRGTFQWTREVRLREYVKRALKATAAVAVIILAGGAVYSLAEGRQFAESCHTALA